MESADLATRKRKVRDQEDDTRGEINKKQKKSTNKHQEYDENNDEKEEGPQDPEYQEIQGDLFLCPEDAALAHCVSKGIYYIYLIIFVIFQCRSEHG